MYSTLVTRHVTPAALLVVLPRDRAASLQPSRESCLVSTRFGVIVSMQALFTEASFQEFCARPENRQVIEKEASQQLRQIKSQRQDEALQFRNQILKSNPAVQRNIAPFLRYPALRHILRSFTQDSSFENWADNPQVIAMLREALRLIQNGHITEQQLEHALFSHIKAHEAQKLTQDIHNGLKRHLTSAELVTILNQHLRDRRQGNEQYRLRQLTEALDSYNSAKRLLDNVSVARSEEQQQIQQNLVATELNIAAVHFTQQHYGAAIKSCTKALSMDGQNLKALMRRAKAHQGRHNLEEAVDDLTKIVQMDPANLEAHNLLHTVRDELHAQARRGVAMGGLYA